MIAVILLAPAGCASDGALLERVRLDRSWCSAVDTVVDGVFRVGEVRGVVESVSLGEPDLPNIRGRGPKEAAFLVLRVLGSSEVLMSVMSEQTGEFRFPTVPAGRYQLEACFEDYESMVVVLEVNPGTKAPPLRLTISQRRTSPPNNSFERTTGLRPVAAQLMIRWAT